MELGGSRTGADGAARAAAGSATEAVKVPPSGRAIERALIDMGLPDRKGDVLIGELRQLEAALKAIGFVAPVPTP